MLEKGKVEMEKLIGEHAKQMKCTGIKKQLPTIVLRSNCVI